MKKVTFHITKRVDKYSLKYLWGLALLFITMTAFSANISSNAGSGNWSATTTWAGGVVPVASDDVTIIPGSIVTVDVNSSCNNVTIQVTGTLRGSAGFSLFIYGNFSRSGTYTHNSGTLVFCGSANQTLGASAPTTFFNVIIANPTSSITLSMSNMSVAAGGTLNITNGTFDAGTNVVIGAGSTVVSGYSSASPTISTTNLSNTATVSSAVGLVVGMTITSTNVPANTVILGISGTTINMSANATATASGTAATFSNIGTLKTAHTAGIYLSLATSLGCIRTTTARTFGAGNYIFNGIANQTTDLPASINNLTINNTFASGYVRLNTTSNSPSIAGTLTMTAGILDNITNTKNITVTNTSTSAVSGGSATSFVNGTFAWTLLSSGTNPYNFPVGGGTTYLPFTLTSKNTNGGNTATVQAFASGCGGSGSSVTLSTTEYWSLTTSSGLGTSGSSVGITRQSAISPLNAIAKSNTGAAATDYISLAGTAGTYSVTASNDIGAASTQWYFAFATAAASTFYACNGTDLSFTSNWKTSPGCIGTSPSNFTTSGNYFIIQTGTSGTVTASNLSMGSGVTLQVDGTLTPAAGRLVSGAGTLNGIGTVKVTGTADFNTQYSILTKTISSLTVDYAGPGAQNVNGITYNNLTISNTTGAGTASGGIVVNGTLNIAGSAILDMSTYALTGTLSSVAVTGTLKTACTTNPPIPTGKTWGGTVQYTAATGAQTVSAGTYNNLTLLNTSGTQTAGGNLNVSGIFTIDNKGCLFNLGTSTLGATNAPTSFNVDVGADINGSGQITLGGNFNLTNNYSGTASTNIQCPINLGNADRTFTVADGTYWNDLQLEGIVNGNTGVGIVKAGAGYMTMIAANTYSGTTTINAGSLRIENNSALGTTAGGTVVADGASLCLANNITVGAEALSIQGSGDGSKGALYNSNDYNTYQGAITLSNDARINSDALSQLTINGGITGTGKGLTVGGNGNVIVNTTGINTSTSGSLTRDGIGTLTLSAASNYTGTTTLNAGALSLGASNVINDASAFVFNSGSLYTNGYDETVGTLTITNHAGVVLGSGSHTLTFANSSGMTWTNGKTLTFGGWTCLGGQSGTSGKVIVGVGGLISSQLSMVFFSGYSGTPVILSPSGEVVPPALTPTITVNPTSKTGFSYCFGSGPSTSQSYTLSGTGLTTDVSVSSAGTDYEIQSGAGSWGTSLTFTQTCGTLSSTTINVRLKAGLGSGSSNVNYNSENITHTSTGATPQSVSCSGTVYAIPTASISSSGTICNGYSSTLTAHDGVSDGSTWAWNGGPATQTYAVSPTITTTYTVTVSNGGCTGSSSVSVSVKSAGPDQSINLGNSATLSAVNGSTWIWSAGACGSTQTCTVSPTTTTTFTVTIDASGASCTDLVVITVINPSICTSCDVTLSTGSGNYSATGANLKICVMGNYTGTISHNYNPGLWICVQGTWTPSATVDFTGSSYLAKLDVTGTMNAPGLAVQQTAVTVPGTLNITGTNNFSMTQISTLNNSGTITINNGNFVSPTNSSSTNITNSGMFWLKGSGNKFQLNTFNATFTNSSGATLKIDDGDFEYYSSGGSPRFYNYGLIQITGTGKLHSQTAGASDNYFYNYGKINTYDFAMDNSSTNHFHNYCWLNVANNLTLNPQNASYGIYGNSSSSVVGRIDVGGTSTWTTGAFMSAGQYQDFCDASKPAGGWDVKGGHTEGGTVTYCDPTTAFGAKCYNNALLPIELIYFNAACAESDENKIEFTWATATETKNDFFTIQKSTDGEYFENIKRIQGAGNSSKLIEYKSDVAIEENDNSSVYYRLKQTDFNGASTFSNVISFNGCKKDFAVKVFNNGSTESRYIIIQIRTDEAFLGTVALYDMSGRLVNSKESMINGTIQIIFPDLSAGLYLLQITGINKNYTKKIVVR